jgi:hypothetical protein
MRQQNNGRRRQSRGSNRRSYGGNNGNINKNTVIDSLGPDTRQRGTASQLHEKYSSLASDATGSDDRILAESYLQFADHYYRLNKEIDLNHEARENKNIGEKETIDNNVNNNMQPIPSQNENFNKPPRRKRAFQAKEKELLNDENNGEDKTVQISEAKTETEPQLDIK